MKTSKITGHMEKTASSADSFFFSSLVPRTKVNQLFRMDVCCLEIENNKQIALFQKKKIIIIIKRNSYVIALVGIILKVSPISLFLK